MREMVHMFNAPPVNPLSPGLLEVLGIFGGGIPVAAVGNQETVKLKTVQLVVPEGKFYPGLAGQTERALQRYAECWIPQ
jgi:hypothetical protein